MLYQFVNLYSNFKNILLQNKLHADWICKIIVTSHRLEQLAHL